MNIQRGQQFERSVEDVGSSDDPLRQQTSRSSQTHFSPSLLRGALTAAASGLLFGFDTAVIAGSTAPLTRDFHLNRSTLGITVSIALCGTVIGSLITGKVAERFGSRFCLRVLASFYLVSALCCAVTPTWSGLLIARFVGGLGIGGSSVVAPVYVAELAPEKWRGRMVGLFQINIVLGVLVAYLSSFLLERAALPFALWRWQLGVAFIPATILILLLVRIPQSPRWLVTQGRNREAAETLQILGVPGPEHELRLIEESFRAEQQTRSPPLFTRALLRPILLAAGLGAFNQLTGINAILYYLNDIFTTAGYSRLSASSLAVTIGVLNLVATIGAISVIDRLGRRPLLLIGSVGTAVTLGLVSLIFHQHANTWVLIWLLAAYMIFFVLSQGAVIWVYISEIFPNATRSRGQSLGTTAHWIMNALIAALFPVLSSHGMWIPFAGFSFFMFLQLIFVFRYVPETRGLTLEEISELMKPRVR